MTRPSAIRRSASRREQKPVSLMCLFRRMGWAGAVGAACCHNRARGAAELARRLSGRSARGVPGTCSSRRRGARSGAPVAPSPRVPYARWPIPAQALRSPDRRGGSRQGSGPLASPPGPMPSGPPCGPYVPASRTGAARGTRPPGVAPVTPRLCARFARRMRRRANRPAWNPAAAGRLADDRGAWQGRTRHHRRTRASRHPPRFPARRDQWASWCGCRSPGPPSSRSDPLQCPARRVTRHPSAAG